MSLTHEDSIKTLEWAVEECNKMKKIRDSIKRYNTALGGFGWRSDAEKKALNEICNILDMHYEEKTKTRRSKAWKSTD